MPRRRKRQATSLMFKATELAIAVPQVVRHRVTRMALARTLPTARDQREFRQMGLGKMAAFTESWNAMATQALRYNYVLVASFWRSWSTGKPTQFNGSQVHNAALAVLGKGIGPVHRRAVANAKRLARTRLR
jgi:hypothetical protein